MYDEFGLRSVKPNTNFSCFETSIEVDGFRAAMRDNMILVGCLFQPFNQWARVGISKPEELAYFVRTCKSLYG